MSQGLHGQQEMLTGRNGKPGVFVLNFRQNFNLSCVHGGMHILKILEHSIEKVLMLAFWFVFQS